MTTTELRINNNTIHKSRYYRRRRPRNQQHPSTLSTFITLLLLLLTPTISSTEKGGWRDWNYYQLLDLLPSPTSTDGALKSRKRRVTERSRIKPKDVKRAYRSQAQLWHPDKIASRQRKRVRDSEDGGGVVDDDSNGDGEGGGGSGGGGSGGGEDVSVEECTDRFARIAEAYDVLTDEEKRYEYDLFLLDQEDEMEMDRKRAERRKQQESTRMNSMGGGGRAQKTRRKSFFENMENFRVDPMAVFEEFFFGTGDDDYPYGDDDDDVDGFMSGSSFFSSFFGGGGERSSRQNRNGGGPDRTSETTEIRYDPRFGQDVHRVVLREEFDQYDRQHGQRVYYRTIAQEFIQDRGGRHYKNGVGYIPITEPYLVNEGYMEPRYPHQDGFGSTADTTRVPLAETASRLTSESYIAPHRSHSLRSDNQRYYLYLKPDCELVVVEDVGRGEQNPVRWTSETFVPPQFRDRGRGGEVCFLALYDGRLAIMAGGTVAKPRTLLWSSKDPPGLRPGTEGIGEETVEYYASLDDDGCLAVYRMRGGGADADTDDFYNQEDQDEEESGGISYSLAQWWRYLLKKMSSSSSSSSTTTPTTLAAAAWHSLRKHTISFFRRRTTSSTRHNTTTEGRYSKIPHTSRHFHFNANNPRDECIYASGPLGCFTPGRYIIHVSRNIQRHATAKVESFLTYLSEGDEHDEDLLDSFLRVTGRTTTAIGRSVLRVATDVQKITNVVGGRIRSDYFRIAASVKESERGKLAYKKVMLKYGEFVEFLTETGEEDEDVLETLVRVTGKGATNMALSGIEGGKVVAKKVQGAVVSKVVKLQSLLDKERFGIGIDNFDE